MLIFEQQVISDAGEILHSVKVNKKRLRVKFTQEMIEETSHIADLPANLYKFIGLLKPYLIFNTNILKLITQDKKAVAVMLGVAMGSYYKMYSELKKRKWVIEVEGYDLINPKYIWYGEISERLVIIKKLEDKKIKF